MKSKLLTSTVQNQVKPPIKSFSTNLSSTAISIRGSTDSTNYIKGKQNVHIGYNNNNNNGHEQDSGDDEYEYDNDQDNDENHHHHYVMKNLDKFIYDDDDDDEEDYLNGNILSTTQNNNTKKKKNNNNKNNEKYDLCNRNDLSRRMNKDNIEMRNMNIHKTPEKSNLESYYSMNYSNDEPIISKNLINFQKLSLCFYSHKKKNKLGQKEKQHECQPQQMQQHEYQQKQYTQKQYQQQQQQEDVRSMNNPFDTGLESHNQTQDIESFILSSKPEINISVLELNDNQYDQQEQEQEQEVKEGESSRLKESKREREREKEKEREREREEIRTPKPTPKNNKDIKSKDTNLTNRNHLIFNQFHSSTDDNLLNLSKIEPHESIQELKRNELGNYTIINLKLDDDNSSDINIDTPFKLNPKNDLSNDISISSKNHGLLFDSDSQESFIREIKANIRKEHDNEQMKFNKSLKSSKCMSNLNYNDHIGDDDDDDDHMDTLNSARDNIIENTKSLTKDSNYQKPKDHHHYYHPHHHQQQPMPTTPTITTTTSNKSKPIGFKASNKKIKNYLQKLEAEIKELKLKDKKASKKLKEKRDIHESHEYIEKYLKNLIENKLIPPSRSTHDLIFTRPNNQSIGKPTISSISGGVSSNSGITCNGSGSSSNSGGNGITMSLSKIRKSLIEGNLVAMDKFMKKNTNTNKFYSKRNDSTLKDTTKSKKIIGYTSIPYQKSILLKQQQQQTLNTTNHHQYGNRLYTDNNHNSNNTSNHNNNSNSHTNNSNKFSKIFKTIQNLNNSPIIMSKIMTKSPKNSIKKYSIIKKLNENLMDSSESDYKPKSPIIKENNNSSGYKDIWNIHALQKNTKNNIEMKTTLRNKSNLKEKVIREASINIGLNNATTTTNGLSSSNNQANYNVRNNSRGNSIGLHHIFAQYPKPFSNKKSYLKTDAAALDYRHENLSKIIRTLGDDIYDLDDLKLLTMPYNSKSNKLIRKINDSSNNTIRIQTDSSIDRKSITKLIESYNHNNTGLLHGKYKLDLDNIQQQYQSDQLLLHNAYQTHKSLKTQQQQQPHQGNQSHQQQQQQGPQPNQTQQQPQQPQQQQQKALYSSVSAIPKFLSGNNSSNTNNTSSISGSHKMSLSDRYKIYTKKFY